MKLNFALNIANSGINEKKVTAEAQSTAENFFLCGTLRSLRLCGYFFD
jgi:hypothetical protein